MVHLQANLHSRTEFKINWVNRMKLHFDQPPQNTAVLHKLNQLRTVFQYSMLSRNQPKQWVLEKSLEAIQESSLPLLSRNYGVDHFHKIRLCFGHFDQPAWDLPAKDLSHPTVGTNRHQNRIFHGLEFFLL